MAVATAQVSVTTSATAIVGADTDTRQGQSTTVWSATAFYVGPVGVTTANGFLVPANTPYSADLDAGELLFGVTASGSALVYVSRVGA